MRSVGADDPPQREKKTTHNYVHVLPRIDQEYFQAEIPLPFQGPETIESN